MVPKLFNRFQLRLLLYLLLVGSIPLIAAVYLFYQQSLSFSKKELTAYAEQAHEQLLARTQQELDAVSRLARLIASDYAVGRYAALDERNQDSEAALELKAYIDRLLASQMAQDRYVEQICLERSVSNRTMCAGEAEDAGLMNRRQDGKLRSFEPVDSDNKDLPSPMVSYSESLSPSHLNNGLGRVTVWFNVSKWMRDIGEQHSMSAYALLDQQSRIVYRSGDFSVDALKTAVKDGLISDGEVIHSVRRLQVSDQTWMSYYQAKNTLTFTAIPNLRVLLIVLFVIMIALSLISSIVCSRYVVKPLGIIKHLMKRAELGDLRAYWTSKGNDEWNGLGQSYNQMLNRLEDLIKQVKLEESLKKEAEMEALHYQLNPHFLYNTLNTIKWVAKIHKTPQISEVVSALVRLLQASLGKKGEFITLREESGLIRDYMEIQSFRYGDRVQVHYELDASTLGCLVPRMILQPLIENAIIHGIEPAKRDGVITIRSWLDRDLLFCQVEDNGIGMSGQETPHSFDLEGSQPGKSKLRERMSGIGLSHIREKIKLYYGAPYKMHVSGKRGEGTTIRMTLPIHQSEEECSDERAGGRR